jgi:four helix bundle protein
MARFAQIALGSLYELDTLLQIAAELKIADPTAIRPVHERLSLLARQISSFIQKSRSAA